jgi:hypothetical protein
MPVKSKPRWLQREMPSAIGQKTPPIEIPKKKNMS